MKRFLRLAFALAAVSSVAAAQPAPKNTAQSKSEKPLRINYDDADEVLGTLMRPDDAFITGRTGVKHPSLIKLRANFFAEMYRAAESL